MAEERLKLRARDVDDMRVISAVLQDALTPLGDMAFQKEEKRFVLVANRFMWERIQDPDALELPDDGTSPLPPESPAEGEGAGEGDDDATFEEEGPLPRYQRVNCGLSFERVGQVQVQGLDLQRRDQILNLLAIDWQPDAVTLIFSEGAAIRLIGHNMVCHLEDLGEPWPTDWRPGHELDGAELD